MSNKGKDLNIIQTDDLKANPVILNGGKVGAIPEHLYENIAENLKKINKTKETKQNEIELSALKLEKLETELKDIDEALAVTDKSDPMYDKIIQYRKKVEDKMVEINNVLNNQNANEPTSDTANNDQPTLETKDVEEPAPQYNEDNQETKDAEETVPQYNEDNQETKDVEEPAPQYNEDNQETKDVEETVPQYNEDNQETKDAEEPAPQYIKADENHILSKEQAEVNARIKEKEAILAELEKFKNESSDKNKQKKELLEKLTEQEQQIQELNQKIINNDVSYPEQSEEPNLDNQETNQQEDFSDIEKAIFGEPYNEEPLEEELQKEKKPDMPSQEDKQQVILDQIARLKQIDSPEAEKQIKYLQDHLGDLKIAASITSENQENELTTNNISEKQENEISTNIENPENEELKNEQDIEPITNPENNINEEMDIDIPTNINSERKEEILTNLLQIEQTLQSAISEINTLSKTITEEIEIIDIGKTKK